jgi:hypothetical protein
MGATVDDARSCCRQHDLASMSASLYACGCRGGSLLHARQSRHYFEISNNPSSVGNKLVTIRKFAAYSLCGER